MHVKSFIKDVKNHLMSSNRFELYTLVVRQHTFMAFTCEMCVQETLPPLRAYAVRTMNIVVRAMNVITHRFQNT